MKGKNVFIYIDIQAMQLQTFKANLMLFQMNFVVLNLKKSAYILNELNLLMREMLSLISVIIHHSSYILG